MDESSKNNGMIATDVLAPTRVIAGKYHLGKVIGEGGMGSVYEAHHHDLGSKVAVKLLSESGLNNPKSLARFRREAKVMGQIQHQNVIQVMDAGTDEAGVPFLVMELLEGESLAATLRREMLLSEGLSAWIISEILGGLGAAHAKQIIHRDLKPGNVFVATQSDGSRRVKLLDFGISKLGNDASSNLNVTAVGALVGTPNFMAPEQIRATQDLDGRIDLYAAGIMLYRMVTGKLPYVGTNPETLYRAILQATPVPPTQVRPELSQAIEDVIMKAIASNRDERFQTAIDFQAALQTAVPGERYNPSRQLSSVQQIVQPSGSLGALSRTGDSKLATAATIASNADAIRGPFDTGKFAAPKHSKAWQWIALMAIVLGAVVAGVVTFTITKDNLTNKAATAAPQTTQSTALTPTETTKTTPHAAAVPLTGTPLYFGVTRHKAPEAIRAQLQPLLDYLAQSIGRPIELKVIDNYENFSEKLIAGELHLAAMSAFNYVTTKEKLPEIQLLATPRNKRGTSYGAYILSRADSEIKELKDFKGKTFCYPSKTSSSGYIFPRAAFKAANLDIDEDLSSRLTSDHSASLKALLGGGCDGASVYDEVFQGSDFAAFTIIRNIKSIPWDAYCASSSLDEETAAKLKQALTDLQHGSPLARQVLGTTGLNFTGFVPSNDALYDSVRELR